MCVCVCVCMCVSIWMSIVRVFYNGSDSRYSSLTVTAATNGRPAWTAAELWQGKRQTVEVEQALSGRFHAWSPADSRARENSAGRISLTGPQLSPAPARLLSTLTKRNSSPSPNFHENPTHPAGYLRQGTARPCVGEALRVPPRGYPLIEPRNVRDRQ